MESRKFVLTQTGILLLGEAVCVGAILGVYALLHLFTIKVLIGGIVGALLATANFFFMAIFVVLASDRATDGDVAAGQKLVKGSYPIRLLLLAVVLFAFGRSGVVDVIAMVLPLLFVRPIITVAEFFKKKGA